MIQIKEEEFFNLQSKLDHIPFTQSKAWYNMSVVQEKQIVFFVNSLEVTKIACWGIINVVPLLKYQLLMINGEAYNNDITEIEIKDFYSDFKTSVYHGIEINSNNIYNVEYEVGIRRAGFKRPMLSFSCPLTIENDLQNSTERSRGWKRNVKSAEKLGLIFSKITDINTDTIKEFVRFFDEMAKSKKLGYSVAFKEIKTVLRSKKMNLYSVTTSKNEPLAYRIIYIHNDYAYDVFASNSDKSKLAKGSSHFLVENIFSDLAKSGVNFFDFGRIPPSDDENDKIYEFKKATRGKKIQYNGEWSYFKSFFVESLLAFYKKIKLKKHRY